MLLYVCVCVYKRNKSDVIFFIKHRNNYTTLNSADGLTRDQELAAIAQNNRRLELVIQFLRRRKVQCGRPQR